MFMKHPVPLMCFLCLGFWIWMLPSTSTPQVRIWLRLGRLKSDKQLLESIVGQGLRPLQLALLHL